MSVEEVAAVYAGEAGSSPTTWATVLELGPGKKCPTCDRRIPHEKKATSPKSVVNSFRAPTAEDRDVFKETLEALEVYIGVSGAPFSAFKALSLAVASGLQDPALKDFAV